MAVALTFARFCFPGFIHYLLLQHLWGGIRVRHPRLDLTIPCANGLTGLCFFVVTRGHGELLSELVDNVKHHVLVMCHALPEVGSISRGQLAIEETGNSKARDMVQVFQGCVIVPLLCVFSPRAP